MYSSELLDHFQNPRNAGAIESPDSFAKLENPVCGDILELTLRLNDKHKEDKKDGGKLSAARIADVRFRAKGCVPTMACGSAITELIKGKTVEGAREVSRDELVRKLGGLPPASAHASQLAIDTLAQLLRIF